jgi:DNA-binding transcriptional LysR family regulator
VVARSDLLTVLPAGFAEAAGFGARLLTRELPLDLGPVQVEMVWHLRRDADPAHRWLREQMRAVVG